MQKDQDEQTMNKVDGMIKLIDKEEDDQQQLKTQKTL